MAETPEIVLAVGGVFIVAWYGMARISREERRRVLERAASLDFRSSAAAALDAEFRCATSADPDLFPGGIVVCPSCHEEYAAGVLYCECGEPTVDAEEFDDEAEPHPVAESTRPAACVDRDQDLVCVHIAENSWEASLLQGFLESYDIACTTGGNAPVGTYILPPLQEVRLFVRASEAQRACVILREYL